MDKTALLEYTNRVIDTTAKFICNSRPRRFGKSMTADMITAYYSKACDSEKMFSNLQIGKSKDFKKHLNQYDVIHLDIQWCMEPAKEPENVVSYITENTIKELKEYYPKELEEEIKSLPEALSKINASTGKKFIVVIDEWDVLIRDEALNKTVQKEYISFLRGMFKGSEPSKYIHLAYLTGILPIKKIKTQSALNNFDEFTMIDASNLAPFIGFTEDEVKKLCKQYDMEFEHIKNWYDGYHLEEYEVYNPKAVVSAMNKRKVKSYWSISKEGRKMKFEYHNPIKFYFGNDVFEKIPDLCKGKKVLLVYGGGSIKKIGVYDQITTLLKNANIQFVEYGNQTKATYQGILDGIDLAKREQVEAVIEIGGASAMDTGKAIAFGAVHDNLEKFIQGKREEESKHLLNIIIPTYPSTGSEANGVCDIMEYHGYGVEIFDAWPDYCLMNPETTMSLDPKSTAYSVMVCFIQTSAWYLGNHENDIAKGFSRTVLKTLIDRLKVLQKDPKNLRARENIIWMISDHYFVRF